MASIAYYWMTRRYSALEMPIGSALGFLLVFLLPRNRLLPGFALYQRYSPFFLIRHAPQICLLGLSSLLLEFRYRIFWPERVAKLGKRKRKEKSCKLWDLSTLSIFGPFLLLSCSWSCSL